MGRPRTVKKVAQWSDLQTYWLCSDGNVWSGTRGLTSNQGTLEEFLAAFKASKYRGTLVPEFILEPTNN